MSSTSASGGAGLTALDGLICGYLALPLLVFCGWFIWPAAVALGLLWVCGLRNALPVVCWRSRELGMPTLALIGIVALCWTALAGIGHLFFANADWVIRDAVLRDLVETAWPPMYDRVEAAPVILRAPVGFYLPVAALAKAVGGAGAHLFLYMWASLGFALVLCAAVTLFSTRAGRLLAGALMLVFGGMDLVGFQLSWGQAPQLGAHLEWWARFAQYSSHSTLMFWVPNHALPAWLGTLLVLRHWGTRELARLAPMLAAAVMLWSPLALLGLLPFGIAALHWRRDLRLLLSPRSALPFLLLLTLVTGYLALDSDTVARGWAWERFPSGHEFLLDYATFCLLEFGVLAMLLWGLNAVDRKVALAVVMLLMLPLCRFGGANDLVMRGAIPALTVLALATVRPLVRSDRALLRASLAVVLAMGALGAMQEPARAVLMPRWEPSGESLAEVSLSPDAPFGIKRLPTNYVARLNSPLLRHLMREPSPARPSHTARGD